MKTLLLVVLLMSFCSLAFTDSKINPYGMNGFNVPVDGNAKAVPGKEEQSHDKSKMRHKGRMNSPVGTMSPHMAKKGHFMFSYRYNYVSMKGNLLRGSTKVDISDATEYRMLPKEMEMHMHMFGIMYSPIDKLNLMVMIPYVEKRMVMQMRMNTSVERTNTTEGLGDIKIMAAYQIFNTKVHTLNLGLGFGLPTGSISVENWNNTTHAGYNMQLGSGSYELIPNISYIGGLEKLGWGASFKTVFRLDTNAAEYRLGNRYEFDVWTGYRIVKWMSASVRVNIGHQDNISGQDKYHTSTTMSPGMDPDAYGWSRVNGLAGLNFYLPLDVLCGMKNNCFHPKKSLLFL